MCGFAGIFNRSSSAAAVSTSLLESMSQRIAHRGPDESGFFITPRMGMAHRRLSIIDIDAGQQPMLDQDSGIALSFNGEIFNYLELRRQLEALGHQFVSHSDTEVVLRSYLAYGDDFVSYLNGQFAIAIWNPKTESMRLLRDRVGICPLYFSLDQGRLIFASEVKALLPALTSSPRFNPQVLDEIFTFWAPLGPASVFQHIEQVQPGELITISAKSIRRDSYWRWPLGYAEYQPPASEDQLAERLRELLSDATRLRLRSDVAVGAYLSGGLDSSAIARLAMDEIPNQLTTFSIGFADADYDESRFQQQMAKFLDVDHHHLSVCTDDIANAFVKTIRHTESPIMRTAPVPMALLSEQVSNHGYKVVLTGEGADEGFGGYDLFKETKIRQFWAKDPQSTKRPLLLKKLYPYMRLPADSQAEYLKRFFGIGIDQPNQPLFSHLPRWATTAKAKMFYSADFKQQIQQDALANAEQKFAPLMKKMTAFQRAQFIESSLLMPGYLLSSQGDRMLAMNAVEGRFPFLDHRLIEFAATLPDRLKMNVLNEKYLLKRAVAKKLPEQIVNRYKQPFRAPDSHVIRCLLQQESIEPAISERAIREQGYFDSAKVQRLFNKARQRPLNTAESQAVVGIISSQILAQEFQVCSA